jgi:hypothetical protein
MLPAFLTNSLGANLALAFKYLYIAAPVVLPIILILALLQIWVSYKRADFWSRQGYTLLEIKIPREVFKSPAAMEVIIGAFFQTGGEQTWVDRIWYGKTRPWFSLEIVSLGGQVHLYVWTWPQFRKAIETQFYSQYPGVEVYEVPDYTLPVSYDPDKVSIWGCEWKLSKADPYPIKTYVDYSLAKDPKEEFKVDPMTPMLEFLGSLSAGHNVWIQIIIRAHRKPRRLGFLGELPDPLGDQTKYEIGEIIKRFRPEEKDKQTRQPTEGEKDLIAAIERNSAKLQFDTGMRTIYIADKDKFEGSNIGGMLGSFKQFGASNLNGFSPTGWLTIFSYPWEDRSGKKKELFKKLIVEEYKRRRFFFSPYRGKKFYGKPFVLSSEELATVYHLPGAVATTPTLERIPSKKSEAPPNLPV